MKDEMLTPAEALDNLFNVIKSQAQLSPVFSKEMLSAVGCSVTFTGQDALKAIDPCDLAARCEYPNFKAVLLGFSEGELKKIAKANKLATNEQIRNAGSSSKKKDDFVKLIWNGARRQLKARSVSGQF